MTFAVYLRIRSNTSRYRFEGTQPRVKKISPCEGDTGYTLTAQMRICPLLVLNLDGARYWVPIPLRDLVLGFAKITPALEHNTRLFGLEI